MPLRPAPDAAVASSALPDKPTKERTSLTPLQFGLARALPPLWKKANNRHLTAREQHKKMLELVIWVAGKHGCTAKQRVPVQYWRDHVKKDGQIDLQLIDAAGSPALLIELDWTRNSGSVLKLQAGSLSKTPVLWISGVTASTKDDAKQLRAFANEVAGKPTGWWLPLFHLEHGWL